jgi:osmotically-inducible protein OsmY
MSQFLSLLIASILFAACQNNNDNYRRNDAVGTQRSKNENQKSEDWQITAKIKADLISDSHLSATARFVSVTTEDGVVTLTGNVKDKEESRYIERKVKNISGVRKVDNQLTVNS